MFQCRLLDLENEISHRVRAAVNQVRAQRNRYMKVNAKYWHTGVITFSKTLLLISFKILTKKDQHLFTLLLLLDGVHL